MWDRSSSLTAAAIFLSFSSACAAERQPFHTSRFPDDVTVSLTVTSLHASSLGNYDYDVIIGLTETDAAGKIKFTDPTGHGARVKCLPGRISVGGVAYMLTSGASGSDWKEDLWESVCAPPMS